MRQLRACDHHADNPDYDASGQHYCHETDCVADLAQVALLDLYDEHEERSRRTEALQRAESEFDPVPFDRPLASTAG